MNLENQIVTDMINEGIEELKKHGDVAQMKPMIDMITNAVKEGEALFIYRNNGRLYFLKSPIKNIELTGNADLESTEITVYENAIKEAFSTDGNSPKLIEAIKE